jgi:hypothetical protein
VGSIPIARFPRNLKPVVAAVAQLVERFLGKDEVMGSSPISSFWQRSFPLSECRSRKREVLFKAVLFEAIAKFGFESEQG